METEKIGVVAAKGVKGLKKFWAWTQSQYQQAKVVTVIQGAKIASGYQGEMAPKSQEQLIKDAKATIANLKKAIKALESKQV